MALSSAKQLLDELMGRDRDLALEEKKSDFTWESPDICKHFIVRFCPNDLFVNTKADLGTCPKIHDERLKKEYEKSSRCGTMGYEEEFLRFCQSMLSDVDKRIRRAKQRLALSAKESAVTQPPQTKIDEEKANVLTERINELIAQVENLGCEGKVEEAQGIMKLCEQLKEEREALRKASESHSWYQNAEIAAAQEKQMEVCEVCGAFLIVGDAQQRVDDHLMGKQHVGYARLKDSVEEILSAREKERSEREKLRDKEREERRRLMDEEVRKREGRRKPESEHNHRREPRDFGRRGERPPSRGGREESRRGGGHYRRSRSKERAAAAAAAHSKPRDKERSYRRSRSPDKRNRSRENERHNKRSRSRSAGRHSDRDKKDRHDKDRKERRKSNNENGSTSGRGASRSTSKGRHSSGD